MTENKTVDDSIVFYLSNQVMTLQDKITKLEQALAVAEKHLKLIIIDPIEEPNFIEDFKFLWEQDKRDAKEALEKIKVIKEGKS